MNRPRNSIWNLRPATQSDCLLYWEWANDPTVRSMAFHTAPIPWESHQRWFADRLISPRSTLFVLENGEAGAVGQVRFDECEQGTFEIDVSVNPSARGKGVGRTLLEKGAQELSVLRPHARILRALVKPENSPSLALFRQAGFLERTRRSSDEHPALVLEKQL